MHGMVLFMSRSDTEVSRISTCKITIVIVKKINKTRKITTADNNLEQETKMLDELANFTILFSYLCK